MAFSFWGGNSVDRFAITSADDGGAGLAIVTSALRTFPKTDRITAFLYASFYGRI
jgi:hypothetical protein